MRPLLIAVTALTALVACNRDGRSYTPQPQEAYPGIVHLGEVEVVEEGNWANGEARYEGISLEQLGPGPSGQWGGATVTFKGTGGDVCVFVDPEAVFWNSSKSVLSPNPEFEAEDNPYDDGDIDLEVGLAAYYTGTPGLEIGDFEQVYEDALGNEVTFEANECVMIGSRGQTGAHAGRATPEYCKIDTSLHPDTEYMVLLRTWSVPWDDYVLDFAFAIFEGDCDAGLSATGESDECVILGESWDKDNRSDYINLEQALCDSELTEYCEQNPAMCAGAD